MVIPLGDPSQPHAQVHLWAETPLVPTLCVGMPSCTLRVPRGAAPGDIDAERRGRHSHAERGNELLSDPTKAWDAWAKQVAERARLARQLDDVVSAHRGRVAREEPTRRRLMLDALAEFAAGAGHELNNPLAVIVGRAQLLLAKEDDPDATRSLRAIITQAQRAARILRDLMYVARPPEPRPRPCQPEEIVRACLRDLQGDADARGVRIVADSRDQGLRVWADPEPLRQIADILARNALEASSSGGLVQFTASGDARGVRWTVHDNGRGIGPTEGLHLFDPFYCGRAGWSRAWPGLAEGRPDRRPGGRRVEVAVEPRASGRRSSSRSPFRKFPPRPTKKGPLDRNPTEPCLFARQMIASRIHRVGDVVAVAAEKGDVQGFVIIPVVAFQPATSPAPGTALGSFDQSELFGQRRGITSRARPDSPGSKQVGADLQVPAKTGDLGVLTVPANLFHDTSPSRYPVVSPIATRATTVPTPSAESNSGASDHVLNVLKLTQRFQLTAKVGPSPRKRRPIAPISGWWDCPCFSSMRSVLDDCIGMSGP